MGEILVLLLLVYLGVGLFRALGQLSRGVRGSMGTIPTLVFVTLFWPLLRKY